MGTATGFAGGHLADPTYQQVCRKDTGHAEVVRVRYDLRRLSTRELLTEFFTLHEFNTDRRSNGGQYRSCIFIDPSRKEADEQTKTAERLIDQLRTAGYPVYTEVGNGGPFYPAEARHQQYCSVRGIVPKRHKTASVREILTF